MGGGPYAGVTFFLESVFVVRSISSAIVRVLSTLSMVLWLIYAPT